MPNQYPPHQHTRTVQPVAPTQFGKVDKDSNNIGIKRENVGQQRKQQSIYIPPNVTGTPFKKTKSSDPSSMNVFERLSRHSSKNGETVEKSKGQRQEVANKRVPFTNTTKTINIRVRGRERYTPGTIGARSPRKSPAQEKSPRKKIATANISVKINKNLTPLENARLIALQNSPKKKNSKTECPTVPRNSPSLLNPVTEKLVSPIRQPEERPHRAIEDIGKEEVVTPRNPSLAANIFHEFMRSGRRQRSPPPPVSVKSGRRRTPSPPLLLPGRSSPFYETLVANPMVLPGEGENAPPLVSPSESKSFSIEMHPDWHNALSAESMEPLTNRSIDSNIITENVHDIFYKNNADVTRSEMVVLKNVVKSDKRARNLKNNDSVVFKDILRTQLKGILRQERIVANALCTLDKDMPKRLKNCLVSPLVGKKLARFQHDEMSSFIEQVPMLEREIILLKSLGERLESKLFQDDATKISVATSTERSHFRKKCWVYSIVEPKEQQVEHFPERKGLMYKFEVVQEFYAARKTLLELKLEEDKKFYIPQQYGLKCTNFLELKKRPEFLKKYLRPKNPGQAFNILDHDPILFPTNGIYDFLSETSEDDEEEAPIRNIFFRPESLEPFNDIEKMYVTNPLGKKNFVFGQQKNAPILNWPIGLDEKNLYGNPNPDKVQQKTIQLPDNVQIFTSLFSSPNEEQLAAKSPTEATKNINEEQVTSSTSSYSSEKTSDSEEVDMNKPLRLVTKSHKIKRRTPMASIKHVVPRNTVLNVCIMAFMQIAMMLIVLAALTFPDWTCK